MHTDHALNVLDSQASLINSFLGSVSQQTLIVSTLNALFTRNVDMNETESMSSRNIHERRTHLSLDSKGKLSEDLLIYHIFFIPSSVDGHLGSFHIMAVVNSAVINIGVHISYQIRVFLFLAKYPEVGQLGNMVVLFFLF